MIVLALKFAAPWVAFGVVIFWMVSQAKKDERLYRLSLLAALDILVSDHRECCGLPKDKHNAQLNYYLGEGEELVKEFGRMAEKLGELSDKLAQKEGK